MEASEAAGAFLRRFGEGEPPLVARAPGRINLIGEHIDYCDLPVLPMAIQRELQVAFRPTETTRCRLSNADPAFPDRAFDLDGPAEVESPGDWGAYPASAAFELAACYGLRVGVDALVLSDLPFAAGLSSSSALMIAVGLALMHVNELDAPPLELAHAMAEAERHTGTQGGGMDQAISMMAVEGHASLIGFHPLTVRHTSVPPDWRFVVANSLVAAEKSGAARQAYNAGPTLSREALEVVASSVQADDALAAPNYAGLMSEHGLPELLSAAEPALDEGHMRRFRHVVTEADRVRRAQVALEEADLAGFGALMTASHESLRDDCGVSCPELNDLVDIARRAGAVGARLTGAGFGGCAIALCTSESAPSVLEALEVGFYRTRDLGAGLADHLFVARPARGASVVATS